MILPPKKIADFKDTVKTIMQTRQEIQDKDSLMYNKRLLDEVYCDMKIINVEVRVISRAEGKDDNSYRDIDNFAYHKNRIQ